MSENKFNFKNRLHVTYSSGGLELLKDEGSSYEFKEEFIYK